jgi:ankyrin repeat protein
MLVLLVGSAGCMSREHALVAAAERGDLRTVQALLAAGLPPDARDRAGKTALMQAAENGHLTLVHVLMTSGADVNARDHEERTVLMRALGKAAWPLCRP